jgi:hypothetical protein
MKCKLIWNIDFIKRLNFIKLIISKRTFPAYKAFKSPINITYSERHLQLGAYILSYCVLIPSIFICSASDVLY